MIRIVIIALVLASCRPITRVEPPKPVAQPAPATVAAPAPPAPVNAVCEAFKGVNGTAKCEPQHTDVGELHIHTATVTLGQGQQFACRTDLSMLGVLCGETIVIKQAPPPPTQDAKPPSKKPAPKK